MCQCRFTGCNNCTTLGQDLDSKAGCTRAEAKGIWEFSVRSDKFCCALKTALKNKVYLKKNNGLFREKIIIVWYKAYIYKMYSKTSSKNERPKIYVHRILKCEIILILFECRMWWVNNIYYKFKSNHYNNITNSHS